jgi:predicted GNAT family N-acyltransferase
MAVAYSIEPLDRKRHDRSGFDCGIQKLNDWLQHRAGQHDDRGLARTYVAVREGQRQVVGYYALASHHLTYSALPPAQAKGLPRQEIPVVLLGRLAVSTSEQGLGLGKMLLFDALRLAERVSREIGARAVEVDAWDETARQFYLKYGFVALRDNPRHLYLAMETIRKLERNQPDS